MEVITFLLVALWLLKHLVIVEPRALDPQPGIYHLVLPAALFVALVAFEMAPLPPSVEAIISPSTFELYQKSLPGRPEGPVHGGPLPQVPIRAAWLCFRPRERLPVALRSRLPELRSPTPPA